MQLLRFSQKVFRSPLKTKEIFENVVACYLDNFCGKK